MSFLRFCPLLLLLIFGSCRDNLFTKAIEIEEGSAEKLPIMYAYFSNVDTSLIVYLHETRPVISRGAEVFYSGAQVTLSINGGQPLNFTETQRPISDISRPVYRLAVPDRDLLRGGDEVELEATLADGRRLVASDRMPTAPQLLGVEVIDDERVRAVVQDTPGEDNWYQFRVREVETSRFDSTEIAYVGERPIHLNTDSDLDPRWEFGFRGDVLLGNTLADDTLGILLPVSSTSEIDSVSLAIVSLSAAAYTYGSELQRLDLADENPFAEPVVLASNVEGGLGQLLLSTQSPWVKIK